MVMHWRERILECHEAQLRERSVTSVNVERRGVLKRNSADAQAQEGLDYQTKALGLVPSDTQS